MASFNYLVRFEDEKGDIHLGEAGAGGSESDLVGKSVPVYTGEVPHQQFQLSGSKATIAKVRRSMPRQTTYRWCVLTIHRSFVLCLPLL